MVLHYQLDGRRAKLCRLVAAATALTLAAAGCSYESTYIAPQDGRARVIWGRGDVPVVDMSGASLSGQCSAELQGIFEHRRGSHSSSRVEVNSVYITSGSGYWSPRYYGPPIIVVRPGLAPPLSRFPVFLPRLSIPVARPISMGSGGIVRGGGSGGGGGHFGGGKEAGAIVVVLAVIAATTLPIVALGLSASMPESSSKSSSAIDMVNAFNDLARFDGTPCTPAPLPEPAGYFPPQEPPQ